MQHLGIPTFPTIPSPPFTNKRTKTCLFYFLYPKERNTHPHATIDIQKRKEKIVIKRRHPYSSSPYPPASAFYSVFFLNSPFFGTLTSQYTPSAATALKTMYPQMMPKFLHRSS